jgi:aspartyl-tRNA(Asn)/glutamyl-tRNA(Gln) amidotransferase subunit B
MFELVIGLEVHAQLNTKTKLFCSCLTSYGNTPNKHTCPVCLGLPGALPKTNEAAVSKALKLATAIGATKNDNSIFERKNYFYPDSPVGYQISQLERPIVEFGEIEIKDKDGDNKIIRINRAHLEVDAGKSTHFNGYSLIDLNRAGTPLLEIVTEPDFSNSTEVGNYLKKLQSIVRYLDISNANMEEGSFRCDVNISIRPIGSKELFTRVEIKNMNSIKFIEKAIAYEFDRQVEAWEDNTYETQIRQETRLFNTDTLQTKSMRSKEDANDYRYFPDPDLLEITIPDDMIKESNTIPEMPDKKVERYVNEYKLNKEEAERIVQDITLNTSFEYLIEQGAKPKTALTWLVVELMGRLNKRHTNIKDSSITMETLSILISNIENKNISSSSGKVILDYLFDNEDRNIEVIIEKLNLQQINNDDLIIDILNDLIKSNPDMIEEYKAGKKKVIGSFVGQIMKKTNGQANPQRASELVLEKLNLS